MRRGTHGGRMRIRRRWFLAVAFAAFAAASPEIVYRLLMLEISQVPEPVERLSGPEMEAAWKSLGGAGAPTLKPVYTWRLWRLADPQRMEPGLKAADFVAELHLMILKSTGRLGSASGFHERLRKAALTIWLSRHWTAEEVVAYTYRAFANPSPRPQDRSQ